MDTITLTGIRAQGTHGVLEHEHTRPQPFIVDAAIELDLRAAGRSDALDDTVDYGRAAKAIVGIIEGEHVDLIERLAQLVADALLAFERVRRVTVTVHKPHAPITVPFTDVSVTITRDAEDCLTAPADDDVAVGDCGDYSNHKDCGDRHEGSARSVHHVVLSLGANQGGNTAAITGVLRDAVRQLDAIEGTQITGVSSLYRTKAWGMPQNTPDFLNAIVLASTTRRPRELLQTIHDIEQSAGRDHGQHWASRPLDIDIIDVDGMVCDDPTLTLPHPRAWQRAFVLVPWAQVDCDAQLAGPHGGKVTELARNTPDAHSVEVVCDDWMVAQADNLGNPDTQGD